MSAPAPKPRTYFLAVNGQQTGPYSISDLQQLLRDGKATALSQIWSEGMPNWVPLNSLSEFASVAPPLLQAVPIAPPIVQKSEPAVGLETKRLTEAPKRGLQQEVKAGRLVLGFIILAVIAGVSLLLHKGWVWITGFSPESSAYSLIEKELKDPASASFDHSSVVDKIKTSTGTDYFVSLTVHAKNSFNATVSETYCVVISSVDGDSGHFKYNETNAVQKCNNPPSSTEVEIIKELNGWGK